MSDYIDETPLTDEEIAAAIAAAKKAKAEKAKVKNQNKSRKPNNNYKKKNYNKAKSQDEESSENLFDEIDSVADTEEDDENLSPKMKSAKSFSNAFAAAKSKREMDLQKRKSEAEEADEAEAEPETETEEEASAAESDVTEESVNEGGSFEENEEAFDEEENAQFDENEDANGDEYIDDLGEDDDDGIFDTDNEDEQYVENVEIDDGDYEEEQLDDDEDDEDDDEDDDDESAFSTKTKVIIGIIIAILVLAIIGAGVFFLTRGKSQGGEPTVSSQISDGSVTGIHFKDPSLSLMVGETVPLEIIVEPEDAEDKVLKLKSNDPAIAKVDEQGKITGVASGSTTVTATLKSNETITATLVVNVIDDDQDAINMYNKFVNSILDGSTDIDSDSDTDSDSDSDSDTDESEAQNEEDTDSDSDTDTRKKVVEKDVLTGSMIKDLDSDGNLDLALYYKGAEDSVNVRIFKLADPNAKEEEPEEEEPQYDEFGNLIESTDTDTEDAGENTDSEKKSDDKKDSGEKVITEIAKDTEQYTTCYAAIEENASWNTCFVQIKEEETATAKVTILSSGYESPSYEFVSEDQTIATVDAQGNIKGIKPGTTFVTVTSPLNSDAMAKIKVTVKDDTDLLDDYLAQIPTVNSTNDSVFPTETLTGKAIVDLDNDGVSELLLRFDYGSNVQTINMVKVENDQCVVYKTYNNLSDLYEYSEGSGYYSNSILVHYTTGKLCMEYRGVVAKEDSSTKTSEQKILSVENSGSLSELVNFRTTTDITTKTVTSEVVVSDDDDTSSTTSDGSSSIVDEDSDVWYDNDTDSDESVTSDDGSGEYYDEDIETSYAALTFDDILDVESGSISLSSKKAEKKLPEAAAAPGDDDEDGDYDDQAYDDDDTSSADETSTSSQSDDDDDSNESQVTSTVTSEVTEETTKYFVNGSPVEKSVYEEMLATYAARYSVWNAWESVDK